MTTPNQLGESETRSMASAKHRCCGVSRAQCAAYTVRIPSRLALALVILAFHFTIRSTRAAPPSNDDCAAATPIAIGAEVSGTTSESTDDGTSVCDYWGSGDVWFKISADFTGDLLATSSSELGTVLSAHTGCPGNYANTIDCSSGWGWSTTEVPLGLVAGQQVWVRVVGFAGDAGAFGLRIVPRAELVYQNGFESADTCTWTNVVPPSACDPLAVFVPSGPFAMGSEAGLPDERPQHDVYLDSYWIDRGEVTVGAYAACVEAGGCELPSVSGGDCNWGVPGRDDHPIACIDWFRAAQYCAWAGKRLPSEAEWEKAARGADARVYPWGSAMPSCHYAIIWDSPSNGGGCDSGGSMATGSTTAGASPFGALDMIGNVWEWVNDWYDPSYYLITPYLNPLGPANGDARVVRGGGWATYALSAALRTSYRFAFLNPTVVSTDVGVRCVRDQ